jgi:hypothetical protein
MVQKGWAMGGTTELTEGQKNGAVTRRRLGGDSPVGQRGHEAGER